MNSIPSPRKRPKETIAPSPTRAIIVAEDVEDVGVDCIGAAAGDDVDDTVSLQSGQPFQFNHNFEDDFSGSAEGDDRPDVVGPAIYHQRQPGNYIQLVSYALPCQVTAYALANGPTGTRHFGTLGRNTLRAPQFRQRDLAVHNDTAITEHINMQLRAEFFNILNHPTNPFLPAFIADPGTTDSPSTTAAKSAAAPIPWSPPAT